MKLIRHPLLPTTPGTQQELVSLHYGTPGKGLKATLQASLHADEVPGMLVAHHLRQRLAELEAAGRLRGEVVLVPAANPIGLHQWLLRGMQGRFDLHSGENFNRHYADLADTVARQLEGQLGTDAAANVARVREALRQAVATVPVRNSLDSLRKTLLALSIDADIVLDLHCDGEALLHFYTAQALWPQARLLGQCLGAELALLADASGDDPFDEACSMVWAKLATHFGPAVALPMACLSATIELRGEADVRHDLACQDAEALLNYLARRGLIDGEPTPLPATVCEGLPLSGSIPLVAPHGGILVFVRQPGERLRTGEHIADVIDPVSGETSAINSPVDGLFFARENRHFAVAGMSVGKVVGRTELRQGKLLSA